MSATTMISGFDGFGCLNFGSAGTPPYESEWRTVWRKSSVPRLRRRRRWASRAASARVSGSIARWSCCISSRDACMKSTSSGSGLRSVRAIASTPRSATSRRRISASTSSRNSFSRASNSSRWKRSASGSSALVARLALAALRRRAPSSAAVRPS